MEITTLKSRCSEAHGLASLLAMRYSVDTPVDSIICLDGTQVIGTYLAEELTRAGVLNYNAHRTVYVVAPEYAPSGQIIFRGFSQNGTDDGVDLRAPVLLNILRHRCPVSDMVLYGIKNALP